MPRQAPATLRTSLTPLASHRASKYYLLAPVAAEEHFSTEGASYQGIVRDLTVKYDSFTLANGWSNTLAG